MEPKIIPAQKALAKTVRATLRNIPAAIGSWPMKLWEEAERNDLRIAGAQVYVYTGCGADPDEEFDLQMCMPVETLAGYTGSLEAVELPEFRCLESLYAGSMQGIGSRGWEPFMADIQKSGLRIGNQSREVYLHWVDFDSPENRTLLQIALEQP